MISQIKLKPHKIEWGQYKLQRWSFLPRRGSTLS